MNSNIHIMATLASGTIKQVRYEDGYAVIEYIRKGETRPFRKFIRHDL